MLQPGPSRELLELWAPDARNGLIITGYSVEGTLARVSAGVINYFKYFFVVNMSGVFLVSCNGFNFHTHASVSFKLALSI